MRGTYLTADIMAKTWTLHKQGVDENVIADVMGVSKKSIHRIINIFELTEKRDFEAIEKLYADGLLNTRECAMKYFGIIKPLVKHKEEPQTNADATNTTAWLIEVLELMREQNALLKEITEMLK